MYKTILSLVFCYSLTVGASAQQKSNANIAPFKIRLVTGQEFTYHQLMKNKPVVLVYFSPSCGHCQDFAKDLVKNEKKLIDKQIVMICCEPLDEVAPFSKQCRLSAFPNIKIGTEGYSFIVQKYYNVQNFPFLAMYDRRGKLVKIISGNNIRPGELISRMINF